MSGSMVLIGQNIWMTFACEAQVFRASWVGMDMEVGLASELGVHKKQSLCTKYKSATKHIQQDQNYLTPTPLNPS